MSRNYNLPDSTAVARKSLTELSTTTDKLRAILRSRLQFRWDSPAAIARALRWKLGMFARWLIIRQQFLSVASDCYRVLDYLRENIQSDTPSGKIRRYSGGGFRNRSAESEHAYQAGDFRLTCAAETDIVAAVRLLHDWNRFADQIAADFKQFMELMSFNQSYKSIKKHLPIGGRAAIALLMACETGKKDSNLASEHSLFNWHESDRELAKSIHAVIRCIKGQAREKGGKAPSVTAGRELLKMARFSPRFGMYIPQAQGDTEPSREWAARCSDLVDRNQAGFRQAFIGGIGSYGSQNAGLPPSMLKMVLDNRREMTTRAKLILKVAGCAERSGGRYSGAWFNNVPTLATGPIVRLSGDDYIVPVVYRGTRASESNSYSRRYIDGVQTPVIWDDTLSKHRRLTDDEAREYSRIFAPVCRGWILLRAGWNDCIHVDEQGRTNDRHGGAPLVSPDGRWDAAAVSAKLDDASYYYFQAKQSAAERELSQRQRIAKLIRQVRSLDVVRLTDSYAAGNCQPGTLQFCGQIGVAKTESIAGRDLARKWSAASYPQIDRFGSVILRLLSQKEAAAKLAESKAGPNMMGMVGHEGREYANESVG